MNKSLREVSDVDFKLYMCRMSATFQIAIMKSKLQRLEALLSVGSMVPIAEDVHAVAPDLKSTDQQS